MSSKLFEIGFDVLMAGVVMMLRWTTVKQGIEVAGEQAKKILKNAFVLVGVGVVGLLIGILGAYGYYIQLWSTEVYKILQIGVAVVVLGFVELMAWVIVTRRANPDCLRIGAKVVTCLGGAFVVAAFILNMIFGK